jgi:hypothetical protein
MFMGLARLRELLDNPTETSWQTTPSTS